MYYGPKLGANKRDLRRRPFLFYNKYVDPWARNIYGIISELAPDKAGSSPAGSTTKNFLEIRIFLFKTEGSR